MSCCEEKSNNRKNSSSCRTSPRRRRITTYDRRYKYFRVFEIKHRSVKTGKPMQKKQIPTKQNTENFSTARH
jgi:hypothetical protein